VLRRDRDEENCEENMETQHKDFQANSIGMKFSPDDAHMLIHVIKRLGRESFK